MRKSLLAAAALAPLWLLASQTPAAGQATSTTISSNTSTGVTTAVDGDITINSGVTLQPTVPNTTIVTVNSNSTSGTNVTNNGTIQTSNLNNVVGIGVQGGFTGGVANAGVINMTETYTPSDPNKDGVNEEPYASLTSTGRYGIQLTGTQPFVGSIFNELTIEVQGDNSYGISLEAPLTGSVSDTGTITYTGDNGAAFRELAGVSGNIYIDGSITVLGQNSNAAVIAGAVGGRLSLYSTISSTDFGLTTRTADGTGLETIEATPQDVDARAGSALVISGSVGQGVFIAAPPQYTNSSDTTDDRDGDGVVDSAETTGTVVTYGGSYNPAIYTLNPAMVIGGTAPITLGDFVASTPSNINNNYSVIIEGNVEEFGVYDNVSTNALQIGGLGGTVTLDGGLRISGSVEATGYGNVNVVGIHVGSGANIPVIDNEGSIEATVSPPNSTSTSFPSFNATASGIVIDPGATVGSIVNSGTIEAAITADQTDTVSATAIKDAGGGITSVINTGTITAGFSADTVGAVVTGAPLALANYGVNGDTRTNTSGTIALDLSANTTGVTLIQQQPPNIVVTTVTTSGVPTVTVTTQPVPAGTLAITTTETETTTTSGDTSVETIVPISPSITGDIYLGNGPNVVQILAGTVAGALSMGSGPTASVTIDNGAVYEGALTYSGTSGAGLTLNVNNGTLDNTSPTTFKTASFTVGAAGLLYFGVDPANNRAAFYNVSGAATVANGGKLGLVFDSNASGPQTYTLVQAGSLSLGATASSLLGPVPYMFNAALTENPAAGTLSVTISPKTPAQLGLNPSQAAALPATYQALAQDTPVQAYFLDQYTKAGFLGVYNQILPDYAGGTFQAANAASLAIGRATSENNDIQNPTGSRGAWVEELFIGVNQGAGRTDGFRGGGFGFVGGVETGGSGLGAFGVTAAMVNTTVADPHVPGDSQTALSELEVGGYWQGEFNGFLADARVGAGYDWMGGRREFIEVNSLGDIALDRKVKDNWNGYTLSGRLGLAYKYSFNDRFFGGGWFVQPQVHADTFFMYNNAYNESEAQGGPALAMGFDAVQGEETSTTASILFGRKVGSGIIFRPELELGVRDVFTGTAGDTTAHYLSGGPNFTLTPADVEGTAGVARFKLKASSEYYELGFEAGGEVLSSRYEEGDMKVSVRVLF